MKIESFVAGSAAEALAQIKARLGPDAMVLDVRKLPGEGLSRLFQKPRIEVLACAPSDEPSPSRSIVTSPTSFPVAELEATTPAGGGPILDQSRFESKPEYSPDAEVEPVGVSERSPPPPRPAWKVGLLLEKMGFSSLYSEQVIEQLREVHGERPPDTLTEEFDLARRVLSDWWQRRNLSPQLANHPLHVFVGPAGTGKTTVLCKWLTKAVLMEGRTAQVWRLDGRTVNTAETLTVYGEILGVPVERSGPVTSDKVVDISFLDLPGINWAETDAVADLSKRLAEIPPAQVHLVLNGAYELSILLSQARAFAGLPVTDLIITHLEEESRWSKLWNLVLGTNFPIRYLSAGQNVPGEFFSATPEILLSRQFPGQ